MLSPRRPPPTLPIARRHCLDRLLQNGTARGRLRVMSAPPTLPCPLPAGCQPLLPGPPLEASTARRYPGARVHLRRSALIGEYPIVVVASRRSEEGAGHPGIADPTADGALSAQAGRSHTMTEPESTPTTRSSAQQVRIPYLVMLLYQITLVCKCGTPFGKASISPLQHSAGRMHLISTFCFPLLKSPKL